ncbi:MAG: pyrimidine reductase family protein [Actinomycetota bacterium]|nr:pyrimidine reductase family protein [Actinomycetota bacterium]
MTATAAALLPPPLDGVDVTAAYAPRPSGMSRPFLRINMITSVDGAITVDGRSGGLGGRADRRLFQQLRAEADVVLVGAGTVRSEQYGPAELPPELRSARTDRGQAQTPAIAVVTRSCDLDPSSRLFTQSDQRPIVVTAASAPRDRLDRLRSAADVIVAGQDRVDLSAALSALARRGARSVIVEGGPRLNADLITSGLADELCLTLAPCLVGGDGPSIAALPPSPRRLRLLSTLEAGGYLFLRYALDPHAKGDAS